MRIYRGRENAFYAFFDSDYPVDFKKMVYIFNEIKIFMVFQKIMIAFSLYILYNIVYT